MVQTNCSSITKSALFLRINRRLKHKGKFRLVLHRSKGLKQLQYDVLYVIRSCLNKLFTDTGILNQTARDIASNMLPQEDRLINADEQWRFHQLIEAMKEKLYQAIDICHLFHSYSED